MQNIPSHAMDIRHMFRATAQRDYCIEQIIEDSCTEAESVVDNGHQVYTPNGLIFVTQLKSGDQIILEENGKELICNVKDIKIEGASTRICYDVI